MEIIEDISSYIYHLNNDYAQKLIKKYSFGKMFNSFLQNMEKMDNDTFACSITFFTDLITHESLINKKQRKEYFLEMSKLNFIEGIFLQYFKLNTNKKNSFITFLGRGGFKNKSQDLIDLLDIESKSNPIICYTIINEICWLNKSKIVFNIIDKIINHESFVFRLMVLNIFEHLKNVLTNRDKNKIMNLIISFKNDEDILVLSEVEYLIDYYKNDTFYQTSFEKISHSFQISGKSDFYELNEIESYARKILTNV